MLIAFTGQCLVYKPLKSVTSFSPSELITTSNAFLQRNDAADDMEDQANQKKEELSKLEDELDAMESQLQDSKERLQEAVKQNDEHDQVGQFEKTFDSL